MIIELRAQNCFSFSERITFSMIADMRNKKFASNVHKENNFNILKAAGVYGPNNAGKTCLVKCIRSIKEALLNQDISLMANIFQESPICKLGISFLVDGREFSYDFWYDSEKQEYPYEKFMEIQKDKYGNEKQQIWLLKDSIHSEYYYDDPELVKMLSIISQSNLLFYLIDANKFERLAEMKRIATDFASRIDFINMNNIPMERTINLLKNKNNLQNKVAEFVKNADLYMDNFEYLDIDKLKLEIGFKAEKPEESL